MERLRVAVGRHRLGNWVLLAALLTILDASATWAWLSMGVAREANPLVLAMIETYGDGLGLVARSVAGLSFVLGLGIFALRHRVAGYALMFATVALGTVALWHLTGVAIVLT